MDKRILDIVSSPADLKLLTNEELSILAQEVREEIITTASETGGHVASSLGAVEIILAVHSMMDCPHDKIVFDVGHQAYAHKLITGRLDEFRTLRTYGGLSGFPKPDESPYDVHPSGHASDSLSVALGLAEARELRGSDEKIVAVIGDAALSGGMAFEALNHIGQAQTPMVIILNDNEMSISRNVGALMKHLGYMRATPQYRQTRDSVQEALESSGAFGNALANFGRNMKESMKQFVIPRTMISSASSARRPSTVTISVCSRRRWQPCCTPTCPCSCTWSRARARATRPRCRTLRSSTASRRSKSPRGM